MDRMNKKTTEVPLEKMAEEALKEAVARVIADPRSTYISFNSLLLPVLTLNQRLNSPAFQNCHNVI